MIEVKMTHDDSFDILDVISSSLDRIWQLIVVLVLDSWEYVGERGTPCLRYLLSTLHKTCIARLTYHVEIFCTTSFEKDQTSSRYLYKSR